MIAAAPEGSFGPALRAGATAYHARSGWAEPRLEDGRRRFLQAAALGIVLVELEWPAGDGPSEPTEAVFRAGLDESLREVGTDVLEAGGTVFVQVAGPPKWASSTTDDAPIVPGVNERPTWSASPPAGEAWDRAFERLGEWLDDRWSDEVAAGRVIVGYGMELDNEEFSGPIDAYAPALHAAGRGLRAAAPGVRVAGGGRLDPGAVKESPTRFASDRPILDTWLAGCEDLGCPLDVVFGHDFTVLPTTWDGASSWQDVAAGVNAGLAVRGYAGVDLVATDLTTWDRHDGREDWLSSEHDTSYKAAWAAATLLATERAGFAGVTFGALFETLDVRAEWSGDWGLVTREGTVKAALHGVVLPGELLATTRVAAAVEGDPFVDVAAGLRDDGALELLLVRFVPDTVYSAQLLDAAGKRIPGVTGAASLAELCAAEGLCTDEEVVALLMEGRGEGSVSTALAALSATWRELRDAAAEAPGTATVSVRLSGLSGDAVEVVARSVDPEHGDAYAACVCGDERCRDPLETNRTVGAVHEEVVGVFPVVDGQVTVERELRAFDVERWTVR